MGERVFSGLQVKDKMILLAMVLVLLSDGVHGKAKAGENSLEVERKLKFHNRPAVKSIQWAILYPQDEPLSDDVSEDGDTIDCVDIYKQPAFDHPALRNHTIQMRPSYLTALETPSAKNKSSSQTVISQTWHRSGSCPTGTIPIRRIRKQDLLRAASLDNFGRKNPQISNAENNTVQDDNGNLNLGPQVNRSTAILVTQAFNFIGAQGYINVWNPSVESPDEFSSAQIWVKNGPGDSFESAESGWVVNPKLYGDKLTRFFVYWTADSSKTTGCFDLTCSGFVQTSRLIALGATIGPLSVKRGPQYHISISMSLDPKSGNWWLSVQNETIGYWPGQLYSLLHHSATLVEWGGEVYSSKIRGKSPHTATAMGSGEEADAIYGLASFITHVRITDYSRQVKYPRIIGTYASEPNCYSAYNVKDGLNEPLFFFGGPGLNYWCP